MRISDWSSDVCSSDLAPFEPPPVTEPGKVRQLSAFQDARAAREVAEAKRAEFELDKLIGTVVDRAGVKRAGVNCGRALRDSLMGSAVRIGPGLVGITETGELVRRLGGEMRNTLEQARQSVVSGKRVPDRL